MEQGQFVRKRSQAGKSVIGNLVVLAILAVGIFAAIQYVPQKIEAGTVNTILDQLEQRHASSPFRDDQDVWAVIDRNLSLNEMRDMKSSFRTAWNGRTVTVTVDYERELNLVFKTIIIPYHEQIVLN